jgi:hypothetical protein
MAFLRLKHEKLFYRPYSIWAPQSIWKLCEGWRGKVPTLAKTSKLDPDDVVVFVVEPPCGIKDAVAFIDGICPHSNLSECDNCIADEFDMFCVECLRDSKRFGLV